MALKNSREEQIYASVLADGLIHVAVDKETPGAKLREYETSDGKKGEKWELQYTELDGMIGKLSFFDGDFGKSLQILITDGEEKPVVLSLSTASSYGEDVLKKLPNIDQSRPVRFVPYSFEEGGKRKKGITIWQDGKKIQNFFYDAEKKEVTNGYPTAPVPKKGKTISTDEWKVYFGQARLFLVDYVTENCGIVDESESVVIDDVSIESF